MVVEKLKLFEEELGRRRQIAASYDRRLANHVDPQHFGKGCESGYGLYTIALDRRDEVQAKLKADGVPTAVYYAQPLPTMAAFRPYAEGQAFPESERLAGRVLSLPMHPYLTDAQADYVCERLIEAVQA